ncbi:UTRA domain-containing protein [Xylocopilactobacillus apis]|uniref:GntR family transcriptional regulator n=1 Tax=Xylocopilactobacillus apis TaxID=2932183 RepID=A0AAU9DCG2_9LACO|nr:UTRA domain-containing protein [Xylocopilactobacillus apis]BDR57465.1 hypothetical protein KIMC2_20270 [Xylocopilactobacillus apis]BDR57514.1 hypothetical protein KIMC2_20760 [Xylocopilactobacillus apis]
MQISKLNVNNKIPESTKVLSVKEKNSNDIQAKLHLTSNEKYIEIKQLCSVGNNITEYIISYINGKHLKMRPHAPLDYYASIYQRIIEDCDLDPYKMHYSQICKAIVVEDSQILNYFNCDQKSKLFIRNKKTTFLPTSHTEGLEYSITYKDPLYWGVKIESINS